MRWWSILNLIDSFHRCVNRSVKSDGVIGTGYVKVDGSGKTNGVDTVSGKCLRTSVWTVSTDNHDSVYAVLTADIRSVGLDLRLLEFKTSCGSKNCTAALNSVGYIPRLHIKDLLCEKTCIPLFNTFYLEPSGNSGTHYRADCRVHSRCVAAACKDRNCFHLIRHFSFSSERFFPPNHIYSFLTFLCSKKSK